MKPLAPNTMIQNRYLVVQPIGKGGMGEVYLAVDQRLGSAVALKRTFFSEDSALGTAFEREARILARLRHPVLPKVIDHFAENGDQYLVMEHISGDDLSKRLESTNKPFPLSWVMFWADQLLDALGYLHTHEPPIIHRDIKPQNLKLTDDNHIVLLDFGLSKDFDSSTAGALNSASVAGYSPHFAAMEQIRGTGTDGRSDLYSLSATLYQLMTGAVPIDALSRADALIGGQTDPIVPLNELNPEIPEAVSNVILKGIGLRQDERFTTASEMQRSLRRAYSQVKEEAGNRPKAPAPLTADPAPKVPPAAPVTAQRPDTPAPPPKIAANPTPLRQADIKTAIMTAADLTNAGASARNERKEPPGEEKAAAASAGAGATSREAQVSATETETPKAAPKPAAAKGSRMGLALAGIFGFVVIAGAAAGGGWYVYNNYYAGTDTPAVPAASPVPEPTLAETGSVNSSAEPETTAAESSNTSVASNSSGDEADQSPSTSANAVKSGSQTKPTPGRTQKTPASKPTAKPKSDDRTVILQ